MPIRRASLIATAVHFTYQQRWSGHYTITAVLVTATMPTLSGDPAGVVYTFKGNTYSSLQDCHKAALETKKSVRAPFWKCFEVVKVDEEGEVAVKLKFVFCTDLFATSNIPRLANSHFKDGFTTCVRVIGPNRNISGSNKRPAAAAAAGDTGQAGLESAGSNKRSKNDISDYVVQGGKVVIKPVRERVGFWGTTGRRQFPSTPWPPGACCHAM